MMKRLPLKNPLLKSRTANSLSGNDLQALPFLGRVFLWLDDGGQKYEN